MRLVNAPDAWTIQAFEERSMEDLKTYLMNMPDRTQKKTLCVMPKLEYKPKDLEEMADCEFYIINGQHNVAASKSMIAGNVLEAIRKDFRTWNYFIVWTEDVDKLHKISTFYNRVNYLTRHPIQTDVGNEHPGSPRGLGEVREANAKAFRCRRD